jgi:hypothetical protein
MSKPWTIARVCWVAGILALVVGSSFALARFWLGLFGSPSVLSGIFNLLLLPATSVTAALLPTNFTQIICDNPPPPYADVVTGSLLVVVNVVLWTGFAAIIFGATKREARHSPFKIALGLVALLPAQLGLQGLIGFLMPRVPSQRIIELNGKLELDPHIDYYLDEIVWRHPIAHQISVITGNAFLLGLLLLGAAMHRAIRRYRRRATAHSTT